MTTFKLVTVSLLGAAGTGKKSLAKALTHALARTSTSTSTSAAPTTLRWQFITDTPLQRLFEHVHAYASPPEGVAMDTESPELQDALAHQIRFDHSLLLGLDFASSAQTQQPHRAGERSRIDTLLRCALTQADVPFQVIYGVGHERLVQALAVLKAAEGQHEDPEVKVSHPRKPWVWACDKCSDPVCEHRLLSDLLLNR